MNTITIHWRVTFFPFLVSFQTYDWFPVNLNYVSDFLGITKIIVNIMKISTKEKILVLYDELINKHQSDCFDNSKFSGNDFVSER